MLVDNQHRGVIAVRAARMHPRRSFYFIALVFSPAGICLPDEVTVFRRGLAARPLNPSADTALPLYVQSQARG